MKHTNNILGAFMLTAVMAVSCVDDTQLLFDVEKPASIANMEYLNNYGALKSYVDRAANPGFKLGLALEAADYTARGLMFRLANANFDEITAGNAMKYASVVKDDGTMDFSKVMSFVEMAQSAGTTIYGHTLVWHAQQNNKYLNSIIADRAIEIDPNDLNNCLNMTTPSASANDWDWQVYYDLKAPLTVGQEYTISMRIKASTATSVPFWPSKLDGQGTQYLAAFTAGTAWAESSVKFTANNPLQRMMFCFGKFGGELYFDDVTLKATGSDVNLIANGSFDEDDLAGWGKPGYQSHSYKIKGEAPAPASYWANLVNNFDCESDDVSSLFETVKGTGPRGATFGAAGTGADGVGRSVVIQSGDNPANSWDTQFFVKVPHTFVAGDAFKFSMMVKADKAATISSQAHLNPGGYKHWTIVGSPNVTTEWKEYKFSGTIPGEADGINTIAFNLSESKVATTYYFDDIKWEIEKFGGIPLTPQEKADTLTWAMDKWIAGMMEACDGYVTAWDVVNEALSGADKDGDGLYDLQSVKNVSEADAKANFYWQDYLGNDFTRIAVKLARQYGPANMKLFVNDYNLESDWDDNGKLKSLVKWIERWESDGITKIDGIGTQMHVSCYMNPITQASKEDHVVKMFELMAKTGKLIKITELDMGVVDASGNKVLTANVTEEQHKAMSEYYKFIVKKYFELIPAAQRYGITQWAAKDSPTGSGWRAGEPIGLWDANNSRKHAYAGFADGLSGK